MSFRSLLAKANKKRTSFLVPMPTAAKKSSAKKTSRKPAAKKAAKKTIKKTATKKSTTKKSTRKKVGEKELVYTPEHEAFWVTDGRTLNSLLALHDTLNEIEKEAFGYHVNSEKNDFADWVEVALCDSDCAKDLRKAKTPKGAKTVVVRHLKFYRI